MLVLVHDVAGVALFVNLHVNVVLLKDADHLVDFGEMFRCRRLKPTHTLILRTRRPRTTKTARFFEVFAKPRGQLFQSILLKAEKLAGVSESRCGVEDTCSNS
jgi:hypothetical protein